MERTVNYLCDLCRLKHIEDPMVKRKLLKSLRINPPSNDKALNRFYKKIIDDLSKVIDEEIKELTKGRVSREELIEMVDEALRFEEEETRETRKDWGEIEKIIRRDEKYN